MTAVKTAALAFVCAAVATPAFAETKSWPLSDFTSVDVSAGLNAKITAGAPFAVRAEGAAETLERLDIRTEHGVLVLARKPNLGWRWKQSSGKITIYVSAPKIDGVDVSSGAAADATGIDAPNFKAEVSSGGSMSAYGTCGALRAEASSGAALDARELKCKTVDADASSGASISVYASESVSAQASSGAHIAVKGSPKLKSIDKSSGGSVTLSE